MKKQFIEPRKVDFSKTTIIKTLNPMKTKSFFLVLVFLCISTATQLSSCGHKSEDRRMEITDAFSLEQKASTTTVSEESEKTTTKDYEGNRNQNAYAADKKGLETPAVNNEQIPQKVIKTADLSFKIEKYDASRTKILSIIKQHHAYVSSENQTGDEYRTSNVMVIRVGSSDFDVLIEDLLKEAVFVDYKKINAEDVTEEFVDISARLKSKKDALLQYEMILKKANSIVDILEVQQYIRTLQEEIESIEGRLKYLNNKVELSTINLTFYEQGKIMPMQRESFGFKVREAISYGWQGLVTFFIGLIYLWPLWLIVIITLYVIRYFVKKARRKRAKKQQQ
jgi:hypothetical protein